MARADVSLPSIFSDHMVLQAGKLVAIWGHANPDETVAVEFLGKKYSTTADVVGKWTLKMDSLPKGGPHEMVVRGTNEIRIQDILVGEVWLCSGQSNMEMPLKSKMYGAVDDADAEIAAADYPQIRLYQYDTTYNIYERPFATTQLLNDRAGKWIVCSPQTAANFTAIGYFVARELSRQLHVPVGIINSSVGGTGIEAWTSMEAMQAQPELKVILDNWETSLAGYDVEMRFEEARLERLAWLADKTGSKAGGKPVGKAPPAFRNLRVMAPCVLFASMISPLIPYTLRGVLWYQGERNAAWPNSKFYERQMRTLIADWRSRWNDNELFFAWVQLPNVNTEQTSPSEEEGWGVLLREGQTKVLDMPHTGMAITQGLGGLSVHPTNKVQFGDRLAKVVLHEVYGRNISIWSGPMYKSSAIEGNKVTITLNHAEGLHVLNGGELQGFAIAGADRKFVWANARIEGEKVVVWNDGIKEPAAVRYGWASNPVRANLANGAGYLSSPFRTDSWN